MRLAALTLCTKHAVRMHYVVHTPARAKLCPSSRNKCAQCSLSLPSIVLRVCPRHALRHARSASERSLKTPPSAIPQRHVCCSDANRTIAHECCTIILPTSTREPYILALCACSFGC